jgi:hypothetical protein
LCGAKPEEHTVDTDQFLAIYRGLDSVKAPLPKYGECRLWNVVNDIREAIKKDPDVAAAILNQWLFMNTPE